MVTFPIIETDRLKLDEIKMDDRESIFDLFSNNDVVKYYDLAAFSHIHQADKLIEMVKARFYDSLGIRWAIRLKDTQQCIGTCGFNSWNLASRSAVIGYDLNRNFWGRGLITEALNCIIKTAFAGNLKCDNINRIQADTVLGNFASEAVLAKLGFRKEGVRRQSGYWKGKYHDLTCYGLLKEEF